MTVTPQAVAQLMAAELREHPQFLDDETAFKVLAQNFAQPALTRAHDKGELHSFEKDGVCRAVFSLGVSVCEPFGFETEILDLHLSPRDAEALNWVQEKIGLLPPDEPGSYPNLEQRPRNAFAAFVGGRFRD